MRLNRWRWTSRRYVLDWGPCKRRQWKRKSAVHWVSVGRWRMHICKTRNLCKVYHFAFRSRFLCDRRRRISFVLHLYFKFLSTPCWFEIPICDSGIIDERRRVPTADIHLFLQNEGTNSRHIIISSVLTCSTRRRTHTLRMIDDIFLNISVHIFFSPNLSIFVVVVSSLVACQYRFTYFALTFLPIVRNDVCLYLDIVTRRAWSSR